MPEKATLKRARQAKREGMSPGTQAGEFVARRSITFARGNTERDSTKQAIAIGLSKGATGRSRPAAAAARQDDRAHPWQRGIRLSSGAGRPWQKVNPRRSNAIKKALAKEGHQAASHAALARQARSQSRQRTAAQRTAPLPARRRKLGLRRTMANRIGASMVPQISADWQRFLVQLGGAVLIIACLHLARAILLPLVVAVLLTFILNPVVGVLQKLRLGRVLSVLIAAGFTFASLAAVGWIFTQQLADLATELPKHKQNIVEKITALRGQEQQVLGTVMAFVQDVGDEIQKPPSKETAPEPVNVVLAETSNPWKLTWITIVVGPLLEDLIGAVFVVALVVLILISRENLRNRIFRLCGQGHLISTTKVLDSVADRISHYLLLQAVINVLFVALLGVGLFFLGVPYAPFFALIGAAPCISCLIWGRRRSRLFC